MEKNTIELEKIIKNPKPDFKQLLKVLTLDGIPDYVPFYELYADHAIMEKVLDKKLVDRAATVEFYYKAGYDFVPAWPGMDLVLGRLEDSSGGYPIKDWETFEKYSWPDPESISFTEFESIIPILPEGMKIIGQIYGIFEAAQRLVGYTDFCCMLYDEPELLEAIFYKLGILYESMYRGMASIKEVGAVVISDDMGFNTQTLISAEHLRKYVLPFHKRQTEIIHGFGKPCILHSCGELSTIMEDIIENVGINAKHSYQDSILPVIEAKRIYGSRIAVLGGIDVDRMARSSSERIKSYTRMLVGKLGTTGGYALGSGNSIPYYVPLQNYFAMLEAGWNMR